MFAALLGVGVKARAQAVRPERKTVYLFAGPFLLQGFTASPGCLTGICRRDVAYSYLEPARKVVDSALLAKATVVAVAPNGLAAPDLGLARRQKLGVPPNVPAAGEVADLDLYSDTYALIARATGGARRGYSNDLEGLLGKEAELLAARYRIGFTPRDAEDALRPIEVRVAREGVEARAPSGQRSPRRS